MSSTPRVTGSPDAIWLQYCDDLIGDLDHAECEGITWCAEQVHASDVRYVRADLHDALLAKVERLRAALAANGLAAYTQGDGRRQWVSVNTWLYPGQRVVLVDAEEGGR